MSFVRGGTQCRKIRGAFLRRSGLQYGDGLECPPAVEVVAMEVAEGPQRAEGRRIGMEFGTKG